MKPVHCIPHLFVGTAGKVSSYKAISITKNYVLSCESSVCMNKLKNTFSSFVLTSLLITVQFHYLTFVLKTMKFQTFCFISLVLLSSFFLLCTHVEATGTRVHVWDYEWRRFTDKTLPIHLKFVGSRRCSLRPLNNNVYYGVNPMNFKQARLCCIFNNMTLYELPANPNEREKKLDALKKLLLLASPLEVNPVGIYGQIYLTIYKIARKYCHAVYFVNAKEQRFKFVEVDCTTPIRYLCQDQRDDFESFNCSTVKYEPVGTGISLSNVKLPWINAYHCCDQKKWRLVSLMGPQNAKDATKCKSKSFIINECVS